MIITGHSILGLLLGASLILLFFSLVSFRRSGLRGLLLASVGLALQSLLTVLFLLISWRTDWFAQLAWWIVPLVDALALAIVLVVGALGGRAVERSA